MAKSKILKQLANNEISLDVALSRLLIIASDIGNDELRTWVSRELEGYEKDSEIPEYRAVTINHLEYSGINGNLSVKNQPLPIGYLSPKTRKRINPIIIFDSISTVLEFSSDTNNSNPYRDLTFLAGEVLENTGGIQCLSIRQFIPKTVYQDIASKVRNKLLNIFIELDRSYGNLDELDIDTSDYKEVDIAMINYKIINIIDKSIHIGDGNEISKSEIKSGEDDE